MDKIVLFACIIGIIVILGCVCLSKKDQQSTNIVTPNIDQQTEIDQEEDFGMYESSLESWLQNHDPITVDNPENNVLGASSLNNAITPTVTDYIPYDSNARFQTPTHYVPSTNPAVDRHIRF